MNYHFEERRNILFYLHRYLFVFPLLCALLGLSFMIAGLVFTFSPSGSRLTPASSATIAWLSILLIYYSVLATLAVVPKNLEWFLDRLNSKAFLVILGISTLLLFIGMIGLFMQVVAEVLGGMLVLITLANTGILIGKTVIQIR